MSGILFVSSHNTGHGHKSITEALREQINRLDPSVQIEDADGFMLSGRISTHISKMYDRVVISVPLFWKYYYQLGNVFPDVANTFMSRRMKKEFINLIEKKHPDLIVSVHPCFVSSVEDILDEMGWKIPVISLVADLDNVARAWADKRSLYTICPTINAKNSIIKYGVPEEKTIVTGFPIRDRFNHFVPSGNIPFFERISGKDRLTFLILNGSQGKRIVTKIAKQLLDNFNCKVVILAGNNMKLKASAEKILQSYGDRVEVCGFVKNVEQYMAAADILIMRASPNVLMEAVNLCKPVVITGALTGQEEKNPEFAKNNNLGVICKDTRKLSKAVHGMLAENGKKINCIYESQIKFRQPEAAGKIAEILLSVLSDKAGRRAQ